jgi:hypothetical protein
MTTRRVQINDAEILQWQQRITAAERLLEKQHLPEWQRTLESYAARTESEVGLDGIQIGADDPVNYLLATANAILPNIIGAMPSIRVRPRRPSDKDSAAIAQYALNWIWQTIDATATTRASALDALLFGVGFVKTGFDPSGAFFLDEEFDEGPEKGPEREPEEGERELLQILAEQGIYDAEEPQDKPTLQRIAPWNLLLPAGLTRLRDCPWVAERLTVRLEELRADGRFRVPKMLEADRHLETEVPRSLLQQGADSIWVDAGFEPEYVSLYEIRYWRKVGKTMRRHILWMLQTSPTAEPRDAILRHIPDPLQMRGYPYDVLKFVDDPQDFYSTRIADLATIRPIADNSNELLANMLGLQRLNHKIRGKFLVASGALEAGALAQLLNSPRRGAMQEINVPGLRIQDALMPVPEATQPGDTAMIQSTLGKLMHEMSGVDTYQRGGVGRKGTTATEVNVAHEGFQNRAAIRLDRIEGFIEKVSAKILAIIRQYWDEQRWIRVVGDDGNEEFLQFSNADIQGLYDVLIDAGSTLPTDPGTEQQAFMGLLTTIQGTVDTLIPLVQNGLLPPITLSNFIDKAFTLFQQDRRALVGPLAELQSSITNALGQAPAPGGGAAPPPEQGAPGQELAGTGPRPGAGGIPLQ